MNEVKPGFHMIVEAAFHSVEFSDWTENPLLMCENFAVNLNKTLRVTKILLSKIQSSRKILLSGKEISHSNRRPFISLKIL